jgi:hypothetical protein
VLHLADIHIDTGYKEGAEVQCGEPLCCRVDSPNKGPNGTGKARDSLTDGYSGLCSARAGRQMGLGERIV